MDIASQIGIVFEYEWGFPATTFGKISRFIEPVWLFEIGAYAVTDHDTR
jgi:hypothetical protein